MFNIAHMRLCEVPDGIYDVPRAVVFTHDVASLPAPFRSVRVDLDVDGREFGMVLRTLYSAIVTQWGVITLNALTDITVDNVQEGSVDGVYVDEFGMRDVTLSYRRVDGMD